MSLKFGLIFVDTPKLGAENMLLKLIKAVHMESGDAAIF